jgi:hypothetical protein
MEVTFSSADSNTRASKEADPLKKSTQLTETQKTPKKEERTQRKGSFISRGILMSNNKSSPLHRSTTPKGGVNSKNSERQGGARNNRSFTPNNRSAQGQSHYSTRSLNTKSPKTAKKHGDQTEEEAPSGPNPNEASLKNKEELRGLLRKLFESSKSNKTMERDIRKLIELVEGEQSSAGQKMINLAKELAKYKIAFKKIQQSDPEAAGSVDYNREIATMHEKVRETYINKNLNSLSYHTQIIKDSQVFPASQRALTITRQLGLDQTLFFGEGKIDRTPKGGRRPETPSRREDENNFFILFSV